jgi:hypothetical protein
VPGSDKYSQAQGVTSTRPGGIDAKGPDVFLIDLDEFLPLPDSYVHALAASFTTSVSDIPIPLDLLGPLARLGEQFAAQMDDALRSLTQSDAAVPLSLLIALMLNFLGTQVNPGSSRARSPPRRSPTSASTTRRGRSRRWRGPIPICWRRSTATPLSL